MTRGDLGLLLALLSGVATVTTYVAWTVRQIRRALRTVERIAGEHTRMLAVAHRHDRTTGQPVRLKLPRGGHRGR